MERLAPSLSLLSILFVFLFSRVQFTKSFPNGAPPQSCVENVLDAIPPYAHLKSTKVFNVTTLAQPANVTGGFTYTLSSDTWTAGVPVTLTINDTLGITGIRGYFYQAFDQYMNRVGTWSSSYYYNGSLIQGQTINCPNGGSLVTHTVTLGNSKKGLRPHTITLNLTIPTSGMGPISISGITLTDRTVWYLVNISTILTEAVPPSTVPSTLPPSTPSVPYYSPIPMSVVQQHNSSTDCWTVYDNNVYDQTYWTIYHPGYSAANGSPIPVDYTQMYCGGDGTFSYKLQSVHNITRLSLYLAYMGPLYIPPTQPPTTLPPGSTTQPPTTASGPIQVSVSQATLKAGNSETNCLMAINGNVYDATKYLPNHPNGKALLIPSCGTDASYSYNNVGQHVPANLPVNLVLKGPLQGYQFTTSVSVSEVHNHNTSSSCWMVYYNQAYDVTSFIPVHPGGSASLIAYCGLDATQIFSSPLSSTQHDPTEIASNVVWLGPTSTIVSPTGSSGGGGGSTGTNGGTTSPPSNTGDSSVSISMSVSLSASLASESVANISATILNALATGLSVPTSRIRIDAVTIQLSSNSFKRILRSLAASTGSKATVVFTILPATTESPAPASTLSSLVFYNAQTTSTTLGEAFQAAGVTVMSAPVLATPAPTASAPGSSSSDNNNATTAIIIGVCVGGGVLLLIAILSFCIHTRNHQLQRASSVSGKGQPSETRGLQMTPAAL